MHRIFVTRSGRFAFLARAGRHARSGAVLVVAAAGLWGTAGLAGAIIHERSGLSGLSIGFWRLAVAAIATLPLLVRHSASGSPRSEWRRLLVVGTALAAYQACFFAAVNLAGVSLATLIALGLAPVLITVGGRMVLQEVPGRATAAAVAIALLGLVLLVGAPSQALETTAFLGVGLAVGSALGYAGVTLVSRQRRAEHSVVGFTSATFLVGALAALPLALWDGLTIPHDGLTLMLLIYLGVGPTALAYVAFFTGLRTVTASTASILTLVEPATATLLAALALGERLGGWGALGAVLLLGTTATLARTPATSHA
jgi:DME family drug/metabolite transporter